MMKYNRRLPKPILAAAVLLILTAISAYLSGGMLARYIVSGEGSSSTVVAEFGVEATADETTPVTIASDGSDNDGQATYTVTVRNTGEVSVTYEGTVEFTGDHAQENEAKFNHASGQLTFSGQLEPGDQAEKQIALDLSDYLETTDKWSTFSNDDISGESGEVPFRVVVTFTQMD